MAMIRVTSRKADDQSPQQDVILNTAHVVQVYQDTRQPARGVWVQLVSGDPVLVTMSFDDLWTLIQRET